MIAMTLHDAAHAMEGRLCGRDRPFVGVSTDSRTLNIDELFVALRGEHFDGHDSIDDAVTKGAAAVVSAKPVPAHAASTIEVADTRRALGLLARSWRRQFEIPVIGITGSNGKTTTKEMTAAILRERGAVLATRGNLNNDLGVPLTLFGMASAQRAAVIEMGANRPHDIAELVAIAEPTVAVVTMAAAAHLEGLGTLRGVAEAKGKIYSRLGAHGVAVINADDEFAAYWRETAAHSQRVTFGIDQAADFSAANITLGAIGAGVEFELRSPHGALPIRLRLDGVHNIYNALAAAAVSTAAGAELRDIQRGLANVAPVHGRMELRRGIHHAVIIDDTYNANPTSLAAGLAVLSASAGERWLVLGDMGELGAAEASAHRAAGDAARAAGVSRMFTLGARAEAAGAAFGVGAVHFSTPEDLIKALLASVNAEVTLLIKGSRVMQLDRIVTALTEIGSPPC